MMMDDDEKSRDDLGVQRKSDCESDEPAAMMMNE